MRYYKLILFLLCSSNTFLLSQNKIKVLDSATRLPLAGVSIYGTISQVLSYTDLEGSLLLSGYSTQDSLFISSLGYERVIISNNQQEQLVLLSSKHYLLPQATISPLNPRDMIRRAFDSFYRNHLPYAYSQKIFYREEFIVNDNYLRFQEMDLEVYQFPKSGDERKFYISGSYPKVHNLYRRDDTFKLNETKEALGKWVGKELNFNYMSLYSYTKGVNILNFIFTKLLSEGNVKFEYLGVENIKGYNALHIRCAHYQMEQLLYTSDIYLEENTFAVLHFSVLSSFENITKQFLDFKTRTLLWLLGIKIDVKRYYTKIQFYKTPQGFWAVEDFMLMFPLQVKKKKLLDSYVNVGYRADKNIVLNHKFGYQTYQENQYLFNHYQPKPRFADNLNYAIPTTDEQRIRLNRMK